jgi:hypothetical protein
MAGVWKDNMPVVGTYNLTQSGSGGISGTRTIQNCGITVSWTVSGTFVASNGSFNLNLTNPQPTTGYCSATNTVLRAFSGTMNSNGRAITGPSCGIASNVTYSDVEPLVVNSRTLTVEGRLPAGETSVFHSWADSNGYPTTAKFKATLDPGANSLTHNFGGRAITQANPVAGEVVPAGLTAVDGCRWATTPWPPIDKLASTDDIWFVRRSDTELPGATSGSYGIDYVGFFPAIVGYIQNRNPTVRDGGSCSIQYPQIMSISNETTSGNQRYGPPYSGYNLLKYDFTSSTIAVTRGGAYASRSFSF